MSTQPRRRVLALFIPAILLGAVLAFLAPPAIAGSYAHPYFDDQGTLDWYPTLAEARQAAEREGKLIFIEYGRRVCTQCKVLCARVLPHPSIRGRMGRVAVGLVAECDQPEPAVRRLFKRHLRNPRMLPFAAFVTPQGRWITGFSGRTTPATFSRHLAAAEQSLEACGPSPARRRATPAPRRRAGRCAPPPPVHASPCTPEPPPTDACCPDGACDASHAPHIRFRPPPIFQQRCEPPPTPPEPTPFPPAARDPLARAPIPEVSEFPPAAPLPPASPPPRMRSPAFGSSDPTADLPAPVVRPTRARAFSRGPSAAGFGDPDGGVADAPAPERFAAPTQTARRAALAAAARGDWGEVIRHTRARAAADPELRTLNRRAHAWAHGRLAAAVRALREHRYADARRSVAQVQRAMQGEPEAIDANRGAEAIELMQDLAPLPVESPVRRAVRRNAYEEMRGSRWAPLFSDCPSPSVHVTQR